ncbi:MAG: hypothetical protein JWN57_1316 [Frankiales bacterium]|nr:hypothetical protein [Frankiales bacterium]
MRARGLVAALSFCLALPACGGDGSGERARTASGSEASPASAEPRRQAGSGAKGSLTEAQLKAALLTVGDLPTGYKATAPDDDETDEDNTSSGDAGCDKRFEELDEANEDADVKAEANFEGPGLGSVLQQSLASFDDEARLKKALDKVADVFDDCPSFKTTDDDGSVTSFTIAALSFPKYGDETLAYAITGKTADFTVVLDMAVVRTGRTLAFLAAGGLGAADVETLEKAVVTTMKNLAAA